MRSPREEEMWTASIQSDRGVFVSNSQHKKQPWRAWKSWVLPFSAR